MFGGCDFWSWADIRYCIELCGLGVTPMIILLYRHDIGTMVQPPHTAWFMMQLPECKTMAMLTQSIHFTPAFKNNSSGCKVVIVM